MPSNCSPSNCVGNSCLIKRRTKKSRRTKTRRLRGGAPPTQFTVVLFPSKSLDKKTKDGVLSLLTGLYGATEMTVGLEKYTFEDFHDVTGLNNAIKDGTNAISYKIKAAPAVLSNTKLSTDSRLTRLEGEIGTALLNSELDVSLIKIQHGLCPNTNSSHNAVPNSYYIGLCSPKCSNYNQETFNAYANY